MPRLCLTTLTSRLGALALPTLLALTPACGGDDASWGEDASYDSAGGAGVGQGGAQDFGQFKQILEDGEIPGPETIDDVGFFNEHKIELPAADCNGDKVCLHGLFGQMGNMINGSNCTTLMIGMNTPIDPAELDRPPLNLALAIDTSGSMQGDSIFYVREGLERMLDSLDPQDRVTLVTFSTFAEIDVDYATGDDPALLNAINGLVADGGTNIYDGLRTAFDRVEEHAEEGWQNRVILLSDGMATEGITSDAKILEMAAAYNELGYGLTTIGVGVDFDVDLMRTLSEGGSGSFYFLEDPSAVQEVFVEEVTSFMVPLAEDVTIEADIGGEYVLRGIYGTKRFEATGESGSIEIPNLQLAHRESVDDNEGGRRGGGGAILLELLPRKEAGGQDNYVGSLTLRYRDALSDEMVEQVISVDAPLGPTDEGSYFETKSVEKGFVMLNIYMGFQMAATRAKSGDDRGALNVLLGLETGVVGWLNENPDADIEDDLKYIRLFIANLRARGAEEPPPSQDPPEPWPQD